MLARSPKGGEGKLGKNASAALPGQKTIHRGSKRERCWLCSNRGREKRLFCMFPFGVNRGEKGPLREKSQASGNSKERKRGKKVSEAKEKRLSNVMTREGGRRVSQYFIHPSSDGTNKSSSPSSRFLCSTAAGSASLLLNRNSPSLRTAPNSIFCASSYHSLSLFSL